MPLTGSITGTLTFVRSGDILTVTLAVSRIGSDYQYREYRGMWLLTESAFTWQAPAGATLGWVPIVTGSTGQLSVGVSTWDSGSLTNGRVTASKSVNVVNVQVKLKNGTTYSTGTLIATLPEAYRPTQALSQVVGASGWGQGTVSILTDGSVKAKTSANVLDDGGGESRYQFTWIAPNADPAHVLSVDSVDFSSQITGEAWTTGINKSAIYDPVSGIVRISGTVSSSLSNLSIDSNCLTVPAEYRPLTAQYGNFSFYYNVGGTYCIMQPSGVLEFYSSSARPSSQSSGGVYSITYMVPKTGGAYVLTKPSALTGAAFTWAQSFTFTVTGSALEFAGVGKLINVSLSNKDPGANVNVSGTGTYKLGTIDAAYRPSATIAGTAIKTAQASSYLWQPHITPSGEVWLKPAGDTGGLDNTCVFTFSYWAP
jgi:hypothetical protein